MKTVKANLRQVPVTNPETEEVTIEVQGTAVIKSIRPEWHTNSNGNRFKGVDLMFNIDGENSMESGIIHEKSLTGDSEKGTEPIVAGDIVAVSISADEEKTYMRVIGSGGGAQRSASFFGDLLAKATPVASKEVDAPNVPA